MAKEGITVGLCQRQTPESLKAIDDLMSSFLDQGFTVDDGSGPRGFDTAKDITHRPRKALSKSD